MRIIMKLRNLAFWHKWLSLVYPSEVKQTNFVKKFENNLLAVPYVLLPAT